MWAIDATLKVRDAALAFVGGIGCASGKARQVERKLTTEAEDWLMVHEHA